MCRSAVLTFAFLASLSTSATVATAAEPVETAIADWIATLDATPDWSARFDDLSYDQTSDTAVLTGLWIAYAPIGITLSYEPISIAGYQEAADGTFGIEMLATNSVTAVGDDFEATLNDIRYEGLDNLRDIFDQLIVWDSERPFTSLMQAYARFLNIRLEQAFIGSMSMTTENQGEQAIFNYENIAIEGWADGKIASLTTGPLTFASVGRAEPVSITMTGTEARGIDYAALMRIYDPDQYVGGVGDGIWRNAAEFVGYGTIVLATPEAQVTIGELSMVDFRVRQPEHSFNAFIDRAMLTPNEQIEPTPEELRALLGYLSSFAIGSLRFENIDVDAEDGGTGYLGEVRLVDVSAERLGEFSLNDIRVSPPEEGNLSVGRIAFGGIVFPPLAALIEAAEAEERGEEFDFARLATQLAFFEANAIDVDMPDSPHTKLDKVRLDLGNYVGPFPTLMALEIAGADLPVDAIEEPQARAMWQALGYDRIRGGFGARLAWNETDETVTIDDFRISIDDVGRVSLSAVLEGLSREALGNFDELPERLAGLNFVGGTLSLKDYAVLDRWIEHQAPLTGSEPAALRQQVATMLVELTAGAGDAGFREQLQRAIEASVMVPGSITATASPAAPVPVAALMLLAQSAPASLPDLLGLTIESTSGKSP